MIQQHYNADGELVGVTEIESPWTDDSRAEAEALYEAEALICPSCGNLREDCSNPDLLWYPQRHICHASRQQAAADRKYGENHEARPFHDRDSRRWAEKRSDQTPFHFRDGVRVFVAPVDLNPDDDFL